MKVLSSPQGAAIYPEYLSDMNIYFCPSQPDNVAKDYVDCPGGWWCSGPNMTEPANGGTVLNPTQFDDRAYIYNGWIAENDNVWATTSLMWSAWRANFFGTTDVIIPDLCDRDISMSAAQIGALQNYFDTTYAPSFTTFGAPIPRAIGNAGGTTIIRLREGAERFMITDINNPASGAHAQSTIPVMWDRLGASGTSLRGFAHIPGGCNVLYFDGHVEFVRYPSKHPVTKSGAVIGRAS